MSEQKTSPDANERRFKDFQEFLFLQLGQACRELQKRTGIKPEEIPLYPPSISEQEELSELTWRHIAKKVDELRLGLRKPQS